MLRKKLEASGYEIFTKREKPILHCACARFHIGRVRADTLIVGEKALFVLIFIGSFDTRTYLLQVTYASA